MTSRSDLRIAFVSAPGGSAFMEEILAGICEDVVAAGTSAFCHRGYLGDVAQPGTRFVVVPHEYFAVAPDEPQELYAATVGFGVEHPGTRTFEASVVGGRNLGANVQISEQSVAAFRSQGMACDHFQLGYMPAWDRQRPGDDRPIDVLYLGTADPRRVGLIAGMADELDGLSCELLIPPHEPMTRTRPDFLQTTDKWDLLAHSKVLINLHREDKTGFEWVRGLEAMINGCVVVTEPSTDLAPLMAGEHLVVAGTSRVGAVARAVVLNDGLRAEIADKAYAFVREDLDMRASTLRLVELAAALPAQFSATAQRVTSGEASIAAGPAAPDDAPMAVWIPELSRRPTMAPEEEHADSARPARSGRPADLLVQSSPGRSSAPQVDVLCTRLPGDGPLAITTASLAGSDFVAVRVLEAPAEQGASPAAGIDTYVSAARSLDRGRARNLLLEQTGADLVCVIDSGDATRQSVLRSMVSAMREDDSLDVVFAMATLGSQRMINVLIPERRRLVERDYLTRGYVVRRRWLERLGGFDEVPGAEVDHEFWLRTASEGASVRLLRTVGFQLWPRSGS